MKTIVCAKPGEFVMREQPMPQCRHGEALVKVERIGVCGTDIHAFHGNQPYFSYPRILGHELSGTIEELDGGDEQGVAVGDQVAIVPYLHCGECIACRSGKTNCCTNMQVLGVHRDGGMAEYITVPVTHLIRTNKLSLEQSAVLEPLAIGAHAVRRAHIQPGETVLVIGSGPIGLGVMAFAAGQGARLIVMDVNKERLEFCQSWCNVEATINARQNPVQTLMELTDGDFPTVVFDATGNAKSMTDTIQYVAHGGRIVFVGLVKDEISFSDPEFHKRELTIMSSRNATKEDFNTVLQRIDEGFVPTDLYVTHHLSFTEVIDQFTEVTGKDSKCIKCVIDMTA